MRADPAVQELPPEPRAVLAPPVQQALARLRAARELLSQATSPHSMSPIRRMNWATQADQELAAAERILRTATPHPIL